MNGEDVQSVSLTTAGYEHKEFWPEKILVRCFRDQNWKYRDLLLQLHFITIQVIAPSCDKDSGSLRVAQEPLSGVETSVR